MLDTALIFSAGRGERLMPYTKDTPKPMVLVNNKPLLEYHLKCLSAIGVKNVIINLAYLGYKIKHYFGSGQQFGVNIEYFAEPPGGLETGGTLAMVVRHYNLSTKLILCLNADIYTHYIPQQNLDIHDNCNGHLILVPHASHLPPGNFGLSTTNNLILPHSTEYIFSGIAYYKTKSLLQLPIGRHSLRDWIFAQIAAKKLTGEVYSGFWQDIGTPAALKNINYCGFVVTSSCG